MQPVVYDLSRPSVDEYRAPDHRPGEQWPGVDRRLWTQTTLRVAWLRPTPMAPSDDEEEEEDP